MRAAALGCLLLAGCATPARIPVASIPLAAPGANHALALNVGGHADTGVSLARLRGASTLAARFVVQYPRGPTAWVFGESGPGSFVAGKHGDDARLVVDLGAGPVSIPRYVQRATWHHLALVTHGGRVDVYVDGELQGAVIEPPLDPAGATLRLGASGAGHPAEQLLGLLDDVWILGEALSPEAIAELARGGPPPEGVNVLAAFTFEPGGPMPALVGDARMVAAPAGATPPFLEPALASRLDLPVAGAWRVVQGYETWSSHHGYAAFALDLVPDEAMAPGATGEKLEDWPCFGRPILAPASGVVVRAVGDVPDPPPGERARTGNTLMIEHAPGEFSEFVHLKQGSLRHAVGDRVERGEVIGACGNSYNAGTPHLHWALLRSIDPIMTRPARFDRFEVRLDDGWVLTSGVPAEGQVIRALPPEP